jgi:hypothetical protein
MDLEELMRELGRVKRVRQDLLDSRSHEALSRYAQDLEARLDAALRASAHRMEMFPQSDERLDASRQ